MVIELGKPVVLATGIGLVYTVNSRLADTLLLRTAAKSPAKVTAV